jgi:hypothetical protein
VERIKFLILVGIYNNDRKFDDFMARIDLAILDAGGFKVQD